MNAQPYSLTVSCDENGDLTLATVDEAGKFETLTNLGSVEVLATPAGMSVRFTKSKTAKSAVENLFAQLGAATENGAALRERSAYL